MPRQLCKLHFDSLGPTTQLIMETMWSSSWNIALIITHLEFIIRKKPKNSIKYSNGKQHIELPRISMDERINEMGAQKNGVIKTAPTTTTKEQTKRNRI